MKGDMIKVTLDQMKLEDYGIIENSIFKPYIDTIIIIGKCVWNSPHHKQVMSRMIVNEEKISNYPQYENRDNKNNVIILLDDQTSEKVTKLNCNITYDSDNTTNIGFIPGFAEHVRQASICCDTHEVEHPYISPYNFMFNKIWKPYREILKTTIFPLPNGDKHPIIPSMHLAEIKPQYFFTHHEQEEKDTYYVCFFNMGIMSLLDKDKSSYSNVKQYVEAFLKILTKENILDKCYIPMLNAMIDLYKA